MLEEKNNFWSEEAKAIQLQIGYIFCNQKTLKSAFIHCSYANEVQSDCSTNERLEFLGDAVLNLVTAQHLFTNYPELDEGDLTKIRSRVVDSKSCCLYIQTLDLGRYILLGKGEKLDNGRCHINILADLFESLVGAIYLDGGFEAAQRFLLISIQPAIQKAVEKPCENWKAQLQEFCQKVKKERPSYETLATTGLDHNRQYTCGVFLHGNLIGKGKGVSKKQAQQEAAKEGIAFLQNAENKT